MDKWNYERLVVTTIVIKSNLPGNCDIDDPIMSPSTCALFRKARLTIS